MTNDKPDRHQYIYNDIGNILKQIREFNGLSMKSAAHHVGKETSNYRKIENGTSRVSLRALHDIAMQYGFKVKITLVKDEKRTTKID